MTVTFSNLGASQLPPAFVTYPGYEAYSGIADTVEASEIETIVSLPDIPSRHYCLQQPISILVERDDGGYTVSHPATEVFSYAQELEAALDLFYSALIDQYEFLDSNEDSLSPALQGDLETFRKFLSPC